MKKTRSVPIQDSYHICDISVYNELKPTLNISSDLDKIVFFILEKNIRISSINAEYTQTNVRESSRCKLKSKDTIGVTGFSPNEDELIQKNWSKLIKKLSI